jgi:cellulose synthase/poly-beta-1,6-N-acetylglucosamine synthase-like glycosyltransferase
MEIVIYCIALIFLYYGIQIILLIYGLNKVKPFHYLKNELNDTVKFSIVIPFKNEANNLPHLLDSLAQLRYNKLGFEIIFINDSSTDDSLKIINEWRFLNPYIHLTVLDNVVMSQSSKKDAITRAITVAKHPWIFTVDADCELPNDILNCYATFINENPDKEFLVGGVTIVENKNLLSTYQTLDFSSLQAVTIGSFGIDEAFMCNGANLVYTKNIFNAVNGFIGVNHIASGDDVFLLQKVLANKQNAIAYVLNTSALVTTQPVSTWKQLIVQRARWGKKAQAYQTIYPKVLGVFTVLTNVGLFFLLVSLLFTTYYLSITFLIVFKFIIDLLILTSYKFKVNKNLALILYPFSFVIYPIITLFVLIRMSFFNKNWIK